MLPIVSAWCFEGKMKAAIFILLNIYISLVAASIASGLENSSLYMNSLSDSTKYDRRIRPYHMNDTLEVTVYITVVSFGGVAEMKSEFSLDIFFMQIWKDPRLRHNEKYTVILSGLDRNLIWLPDTFFMNIKEAQQHRVPSDNSQVLINKHGTVQYSTRITLTAGCEMDLHHYPLDTQICKLQIMSYAYNQKEIDYRWKGDKDISIILMNDHLSQLALKDFQIDKKPRTFGGITFTELMAIFKFQRRLGYSLLQIYAPTFLIVCLSWLSFWISKDAVSARIALGITTILTLVTLNGSFRAAVPKVSYIKAMDLYLIVSLFFVFGAVMEYIAVLSYEDFVKHKLSLAKKHDIEDETEEEEQDTGEEDVTTKTEVPEEEITVMRSVDYGNKRSRKPLRLTAAAILKNIITANSTPIDKISKLAFPICFILFNVVYWIYYGL